MYPIILGSANDSVNRRRIVWMCHHLLNDSEVSDQTLGLLCKHTLYIDNYLEL